jgi:hypothetical protein
MLVGLWVSLSLLLTIPAPAGAHGRAKRLLALKNAAGLTEARLPKEARIISGRPIPYEVWYGKINRPNYDLLNLLLLPSGHLEVQARVFSPSFPAGFVSRHASVSLAEAQEMFGADTVQEALRVALLRDPASR